jgi:hypothetical protein
MDEKRLEMNTQKTKIGIIEELFDNYFCTNPEKRSVDKYGNCKYLDDHTGNKCAVGMCFSPYVTIGGILGYNGSVYCLTESLMRNYGMYLDDVLREEYLGHDLGFWSDVQSLHDSSMFWNAFGLTEEGNQYLNTLKERYTDNEMGYCGRCGEQKEIKGISGYCDECRPMNR